MKKLLFVCIENSCRSQMAEGFARHYGDKIVEAESAGTKPASVIDPVAIKVMQERNIDIGNQFPKQLRADDIKKHDLVITMGCGVESMCPVIPPEVKLDWELENPRGKSIETYRKVRDEIENKIKELILEL